MEATNQSHINSVTKFEQLIKDIQKDELLDHQTSLSYYLNFRSLRHDSWVEFLDEHKTSRHFVFGDIKILTFLINNGILDVDQAEYLSREGLNAESIKAINTENAKYCEEKGLLPYHEMRKTPDILCMANGAIYIGDVTVTRDEGNVKIFKHDKYRITAEWFQSRGYRVIHQDFIIREDLNNINFYIRQLVDCGLIFDDENSKSLYAHFHYSMNESMRLIIEYCENVELLSTSLSVNDSNQAPLEQLRLTYDHEPFTDYTPDLSEHEVINMIKRRIEHLDPNKYFDGGVESTLKAFDKIIEDNKKSKNFTKPKSTLKVIDNSEYYEKLSGNDLIMDYTVDAQKAEGNENVKGLLLYLLPTPKQVSCMKEIYSNKITQSEVKKDTKFKTCKVYGNGYYDILPTVETDLVRDSKHKLKYGKQNTNEKKEPEQVNPSYYDDACVFISGSMRYYGSISNKDPFLDSSWEANTVLEEQESKIVRSVYDYVRKTNGAQICHSMAQLYNKIVHTSTYQGSHNIVYVPPNGSFIAIIPKEHGPVNRASCDIPFYFITRSWKDVHLSHFEYEYTICTPKYRYYISKLCRMNINKIAGWNNAGYQLVSSASYMLSIAPKLSHSKEKYIGMLTYMILDCHQKTSEYLDLLKYVSFMPFSDIHLLPKLVADKFNLLIKTRLDVWMLMHMRQFVKELSKMDELKPSKPKVQIINNRLMTDCLGLDIKLPTFADPNIRHDQCVSYIEEISMIYTVRPKHLYGSQFMDKAMSNICIWNNQFLESVEEHGDWVINGNGSGDFPFECDFAFCSSAIYYAAENAKRVNPINQNQVHSQVLRGDIFEFIHYNCTLRGCTKDVGDRKNNIDLHSTSIDECLKYYESKGFNDKLCTVISCAQETLTNKNHIMQFSKSQKEQRGPGRPIATPTLRDKVLLMCAEKPELAKGSRTKNNIIVPKKNKLKEQADNYKEAIVNGTISKFKYCAQITEDQTKFSEMDNTRKYKTYLRCDKNAPREVRQLQLDVITKLETREHLIKKLPKEILEKHERWINKDRNGIKAIIGWPQGMLNFISTSIHSDADMWILRAYNMAYPDNKVLARGLVHSDDSSVIVCFNHFDDYKRFCLFRIEAKRMFCLKINIKKLWGSKFFGEIVSNYNVNGNVHMSVAKTIANSFSNLTFHNWPTDVSNQVSTMQQCYRNGATVPTLIMMNTILKQQLIKTYQVKGEQLRLLHLLPVDLGGYPDNSAFELGVTGITCHYKKLIDRYSDISNKEVASMVRYCLKESKKMMTEDPKKAKKVVVTDKWDELADDDNTMRLLTSDDFENVSMPSKGDIFMSIKHLMPKSNKIKKTVDRIKALPFESSGLELLVTRPNSLSEALGNLKAQTANMFYQLASENYTQSSKRMAMSQTMQSSGKVICLNGHRPMSYNELIELLKEQSDDAFMDVAIINTAFSDDNELVDLCSKAVYNSEHYMIFPDKRKVLSRMPTVEDKFKTIAPLKDVLLYIIESTSKRCRENPNPDIAKMIKTLYNDYASKKASLQTVENDSRMIKSRFKDYFAFYNVISACSLIMRQFMTSIKSRLWVQPGLKHESLQSFIESLYGKTVSQERNYNVTIILGKHHGDNDVKNWIRTIYTTNVLNNVYNDKFKIMNIKPDLSKPKDVVSILENLDYSSLDSDYLIKYGMLMMKYTGNDDILRRAIKKKSYRQYWQKAQRYTKGKYVGEFDIIIRYSGIIVRIQGLPGDVIITSSSDEVPKILMAMKIFIEQNFKSYGYSNPGEWGRSEFWRTKSYEKNFLIYFSSVNTQIRSSAHDDSIKVAFYKDDHLTYILDNDVLLGVLSYDETMRVIYVKRENKTHRVDSVYQDLGLPFSDYITIVPAWLDNIDTSELYHTGVILDLTLDRYYNVAKSNVEKCLITSPDFKVSDVLKFYYNCILKLRDKDLLPDIVEEPPMLVDTFDLKGMTTETYTEIARTEKIEELNADALDFDIAIDVDKKGSMLIHKDLIRLLSTMYSGYVSPFETDDFITMVARDKFVIESAGKILKECDDSDMSGMFESLMDYTPATKLNMELFCFIKASKLDLASTLDEVDFNEILKNPNYTDYNLAHARLTQFKELLCEHEMEPFKEEDNLLTIIGRKT